MKKFYLVHGFESLPNRGFFPWLMHNLFVEMRACAVSLKMPNPENPIVFEWVAKIKSEVSEPSLEKYLVGHSLGVPAILRYLETIPEDKKIGGVFLVAGFIDKLEESGKEPTIRKIDNFLEAPFNFEHIKKVCDIFFIIHGENDTIVPVSLAQKLSQKLEIEPLIIKGAGHFQSSKVFELPELLDLILKEVK